MGETAAAAEVEAPKKRGRPAKPESEKKRKATDEGGSEPKRGRGRPKGSTKKNKKAAPKKSGTSSGRGRGRPKKSSSSEEPEEEAAEE